MDPDEIHLRAHIRSILLDYCNQHLNVDHVAYTEHIANQVRWVSRFLGSNW